MLYKIMEKKTQKISPDEEEIIFECEENLDDRLSYLLLFNLQKKKKRSEKHDCTVRKININEFECKSTNVNCFEFVYVRLSKSSFQF